MNKINVPTTIFLLIAIIFSIYKSIQLSETRDTLQLAISTLELAKTQLDITKTELTNTKTQLATIEFKLDFTQEQLTNTKAELQTTAMQLSTTETQLKETETRLETTSYQLETVKDEQKEMLNQYSNLREKIYLRQGEKKDTQKFITPNNPIVSTKVTEITGGYSEDVNERWRDYERIYHWIINNIIYSSDSYSPILPQTIGGELRWTKDCWRMPEETIEDKAGDCEDMAVLLASMMINYNGDRYSVWAIKIKNGDSGHLAVAFPVAGNKLTILDPAGNYYTGYLTGRLSSLSIDAAVNDWLSKWRQKMPNAQIVNAFSNDFYREFSSTEEFKEWVRER